MSETHLLTVGVKYCGGCNPRYERVEFVRTLAEDVPAAQFVPARPGEPCDRLLVVCGCHARCADYTGVEGTGGALVVDHQDDLNRAREFIRKGTR